MAWPSLKWVGRKCTQRKALLRLRTCWYPPWFRWGTRSLPSCSSPLAAWLSLSCGLGSGRRYEPRFAQQRIEDMGSSWSQLSMRTRRCSDCLNANTDNEWIGVWLVYVHKSPRSHEIPPTCSRDTLQRDYPVPTQCQFRSACHHFFHFKNSYSRYLVHNKRGRHHL